MTLIDQLNRSYYVKKVEKELNEYCRFLAVLLRGMPNTSWLRLRDVTVTTATGRLTVEVPLNTPWRWSWWIRRRIIKHIRATEVALKMKQGYIDFSIPEQGYSATLIYHQFPDEKFAIPCLPASEGGLLKGMCENSVRYSAASVDLEELGGTHQIYRIS